MRGKAQRVILQVPHCVVAKGGWKSVDVEFRFYRSDHEHALNIVLINKYVVLGAHLDPLVIKHEV